MKPQPQDGAVRSFIGLSRGAISRFRGRRPRHGSGPRYCIEPLETRVLLAQTVDVSGLRFVAESFDTDEGSYVVDEGVVQVGFTPSSLHEDFRTLLKIDLTATGEPEELEINPANSTLVLSGGAIDAVSLRNDRRLWLSPVLTTFSILNLASTTGVNIAPLDAEMFIVASFNFKANNLQLINPGGGDTSDSETHLRGTFDFNSILGDVTTNLPTVTVEGKDFVAISPDIAPTLSGATFNVPIYSDTIKSLPVQGSLEVRYHTDNDQNDYWDFSGTVTVSSKPQDSKNESAFQTVTATAGVALKNTSFDGITFGLSGEFKLFGATVQTTDANPLTFSYDFTEDQYEWTGGLTLKFNGNTVGINLGFVTNPTLPGLVIRDGIVESLDANVTTDFRIFGVEFQTTPGGLTLQYDRATEQFIMFGGMQTVDTLTKNPIFSLQMGTSASDAGLLIEDGNLKQLQAAVTSNAFRAGPLTWRVSQAGFKWTQDSHGRDIYIISGTLAIQEVWQISVTLGSGLTGDNSGMIFSSDGFELDGFQIALKHINVGFLTLEELIVGYQKSEETGDYEIGIDGAVYFPQSGFAVAASIEFDTKKDVVSAFSFGMELGKEPFALGTTGLFVTAFDVDVQNPNSASSFEVTGNVGVIYGDQLKLGGENVSIISGVGSVHISRDEFVLGADIYFGAQQIGQNSTTLMPNYKGVLGSGNGTITLDWGDQKYSLDVSAKLFQGAFDVDGSFTFGGAGNNYFIHFKADAAVSVPHGIPFIGGQQLFDFHFVFDYHNKDQITGEPIGYVAAWTKLDFLVAKKEVGFMFDLNDSGAANPRTIGKHAIEEIKDGDYVPESKLYTYSKSFQVPAGADVAEFQVQWAVPKGSQQVAYEFVPTGKDNDSKNIIQQSDFGKGNNAVLINGNTQSPTSTLLTQITDPQLEDEGTYYYYLFSTEKLDDDQINWQFTYSVPSPEVSLASDLPSGLYTSPTIGVDIQHKNGPGLASQTTVTLYADTDNQGYDGFKVNSFVPGNDDATYSQLPWHLTNLPMDTYYVYASIDDGVNPIVYSAYSTQVNFLPTGPISGYVRDNVNNNVGVASVQMYLDTNGDGAFQPSTEPSWTTNSSGYYRFDYEDAAHTVPLANGETYHVGLIEVEGMKLIGNGNQTTRAIVSPNVFGDETTFELQINSSVSGTVFNDVDRDGTLDPDENGAGGWTVYIDLNHNDQLDISDPSAVTTSNGGYRIFNLDPSTSYTLRLHQNPDSQSNFFTTSTTSRAVATGSDPHQLISGQNFGVLEFATIGGTISNYPLLPDGGLSGTSSPPPDGWQVQLLDQNGNVVSTALADATTGRYEFTHVVPGQYSVRQVVPPEWLQVNPVTAGDVTFTHAFLTTGAAPVDVAAADFDHDGDLDIATVAASSEKGTVTFFLNNGKGSFTKSVVHDVHFSSGAAFAIEVIDGLPNTTGPSLAVISRHGWVSLIRNSTPSGGSLSFTFTDNYGHILHAASMHGVTSGDFDEDGVTDLAGSYEGTDGNPDRFSIFLMKDASRIDGKHFDHPGQLTAADMNGDGHLDLVLNSGDSEKEFNIAYGDGTGDFTKTVTTWFLSGGLSSLDVTSGSKPVAVSDVNADGIPDVILGTGTTSGYVVHTQNSLGGMFFFVFVSADVVDLGVDRIEGQQFPNPIILSSGDIEVEELDFYSGSAYRLALLSDVVTASSLLTADLNADGLPDMIVGDSGKIGAWVYLNQTQRTTDISMNLSPGQASDELDFTNDQVAQITGLVYEDANHNGARDSGERGLPDIRVFIDRNQNGRWDSGEQFTFTNSQGAYSFHNLPPKQYVLAVELPEGRILTSREGRSNRISITRGGGRNASHRLDFALAPGIRLERYSDRLEGGGGWTLRRNGAYLELVQDSTQVVLERHLLHKLHDVTLFASNFVAETVTIDFRFGGAFALPGGVHVDGGRDGLSGGSTLRFLGTRKDKVVIVSDTEAVIDGNLRVTWTDNLADAIFETSGHPGKGPHAKVAGNNASAAAAMSQDPGVENGGKGPGRRAHSGGAEGVAVTAPGRGRGPRDCPHASHKRGWYYEPVAASFERPEGPGVWPLPVGDENRMIEQG